MFKHALFGLAPARAEADHVLHDLKEVGFRSNQVSVLFLDQRDLPTPPATPEASAAPGRVLAAPAPSSTDIRGVVAWVDGVRMIRIAATAQLVAGGPVGAAFSEHTKGGIAAGLVAFGVPEPEALRYEQKLLQGYILVSVHVDDADARTHARSYFTARKLEDIFGFSNVSRNDLHQQRFS